MGRSSFVCIREPHTLQSAASRNAGRLGGGTPDQHVFIGATEAQTRGLRTGPTRDQRWERVAALSLPMADGWTRIVVVVHTPVVVVERSAFVPPLATEHVELYRTAWEMLVAEVDAVLAAEGVQR